MCQRITLSQPIGNCLQIPLLIAEATEKQNAEIKAKQEAGGKAKELETRWTEDDAQEILISLFHNFNRPVMAGKLSCDGSQQTHVP